MSKHAIILAGGLGSRLRPYTVVLPKPLMPIGPYPILEVVIRQLATAGFTDITLAVNHQAEIIKAYCNSGKRWGVHISYSMEKKPLGTMGPLKLIRDMPEHFLIMNGDVLTDLDFGALYTHHATRDNTFTVATCPREMRSEFGVLELNGDDTLHGFREKPVVNYNVSMGIYMASRRILDFIPDDEAYGFDNLVLDMMRARHAVHVYRYNGYWLDIGRPDDYMTAIDMFEANPTMFLRQGAPRVARAAV